LSHLNRLGWYALVFSSWIVWVAEAINTALEFLADEVSVEKRELIGKAKDAGAAGVLLASIGAAVIGLIIFVPHWLAALVT
jgi:diacylglycerol kinase